MATIPSASPTHPQGAILTPHRKTPPTTSPPTPSQICLLFAHHACRRMEPRSHSSPPSPPSQWKPIDCPKPSNLGPFPLSEELKLLLPYLATPEELEFCDEGRTASMVNPDMSAVLEYSLGESSAFPFDSAAFVEDLEFIQAQLDFRVVDGSSAAGGALLVGNQDVGFDLPEQSPLPSIPTRETHLESDLETSEFGSSMKEEGPEIATVPVDLIQNRRPFRCSHAGCDRAFKNPQTLKMHHRTHYREPSDLPSSTNPTRAGQNKKIPCRCPVCLRTFVGLYELRRHYGRKHSDGEKAYGCNKCGKKFYVEADMKDHEKLCGAAVGCKCGLKFAFKCNLSAHKRTHPECVEEPTNPHSMRSATKRSESKA